MGCISLFTDLWGTSSCHHHYYNDFRKQIKKGFNYKSRNATDSLKALSYQEYLTVINCVLRRRTCFYFSSFFLHRERSRDLPRHVEQATPRQDRSSEATRRPRGLGLPSCRRLDGRRMDKLVSCRCFLARPRILFIYSNISTSPTCAQVILMFNASYTVHSMYVRSD